MSKSRNKNPDVYYKFNSSNIESRNKSHEYYIERNIQGPLDKMKEELKVGKLEMATESVPDVPLTLTLPEGTEAFKGQIRASNGVLYKLSIEKVEE